jgi:hypothetical protein
MGRLFRALGNVVVWIVLIVGTIAVARFLIHVCGALLSKVSFAGWWQTTVSFLREDGALWLSAIATIMLFVATRALYKSTNIQLATDGPFLMVNLANDAPAPPVVVTPYFDDWEVQDLGDAALAPHVNGVPTNYIYLTICNAQDKRTGVAGAVLITVALHFGAKAGVPPHPETYRRVVRSEVIAPDTFVVGPVLNAGDLDAYLAVVEAVEYRDVTGRRRTAAWGANVIFKAPGANPVLGHKIFEPRKGEYSDGHRG